MLSIAERHKFILDSLKKYGFVKVNDIALQLDVTPATIRNDLKSLEAKKLLYRTHGSASPINPITVDREVEVKEKFHIEEKKRIAIEACKLIEDNDSIIIGSGSTVYTLAEQIPSTLKLTVVTTSPKISILLYKSPNIEVIQLGGTIRKNSLSVIGDYTNLFFNDVTCSKLFLGVDGIDLEYGVTNSNMEEAMLNKRMIDSSLRTIILSDSSKFGRRGFGRVCSLDKIDVIITDPGIPAEMAKAIEEIGIELIIV
jgi:DeoR family transcriptional regulator, aga operon transcriptional repressor